jgi:ribose-phosphate pyrophosphokinase
MNHCPNHKGNRGPLGVLGCRAGEPFSRLLHQALVDRYKESDCMNTGPLLVRAKETHFPNTEVKVEIEDSIRGMDLYIVQDCENKEDPNAMFEEHILLRQLALPFELPAGVDPEMKVSVKRPYSVDENLRAALAAADAARRSDAHYVSMLLPSFPYARQDKSISREGITASKVAEEIEETGVSRVMTLDLHNRAIQGFFRRITCENLHSSKVIMAYARDNLAVDNLVVVSPDEGGIVRANYFAKRMGTKLAMGYKRRDYTQASVVDEFRILGDVVRRHRTLEEQVDAIKKEIAAPIAGSEDAAQRIGNIIRILEIEAQGLDVLFVDDMIATAGSLEKGVKKVRDLGAKSVWFACALPLFTHPAPERIDELYAKGWIQGVIGTNAVFHHTEDFMRQHPWYHEIPVQKYFADAIFNINHYDSISKLLE